MRRKYNYIKTCSETVEITKGCEVGAFHCTQCRRTVEHVYLLTEVGRLRPSLQLCASCVRSMSSFGYGWDEGVKEALRAVEDQKAVDDLEARAQALKDRAQGLRGVIEGQPHPIDSRASLWDLHTLEMKTRRSTRERITWLEFIIKHAGQ